MSAPATRAFVLVIRCSMALSLTRKAAAMQESGSPEMIRSARAIC